MTKSKILAAALAITLASSSLGYSPLYTDAATTTAKSGSTATTATAAVTNLKCSIASSSDYYEFRQGSTDNTLSLSLRLYDDLGTSMRILNFNDYIKEYDFDFEFADKNVVLLSKELKHSSGFSNIIAKLKFPEDTPLREYTYKIIPKKAVDMNGKDVTSAFTTYTGKYSTLDKNGSDKGRPDPKPEILHITSGAKATSGSAKYYAGDIHEAESKGYFINGNINGKANYFKTFEFDVEFGDKNVSLIEKKLKVEPGNHGEYYYFPYVKFRTPQNAKTGSYSYTITVKKAIDLKGNDVLSKLPNIKINGTYKVNSAGSVAAVTTTTAKKPATTTTAKKVTTTAKKAATTTTAKKVTTTAKKAVTTTTAKKVTTTAKKAVTTTTAKKVTTTAKKAATTTTAKKVTTTAKKAATTTTAKKVTTTAKKAATTTTAKKATTTTKKAATTTTAKKATTTTKKAVTTTTAKKATTTTAKKTTTPVTTTKPAATVKTKGDPNGDGKINAIDASDILSVYAAVSVSKTRKLSDAEKSYCDVNSDGAVNAIDASYILSYYSYKQTNGKDSFADYMKKH